MPIFPGPVSHNNPNAPIIKLEENQVKGMGIFANVEARSGLNVSLRVEGYTAILKDTDETFVFTSSSMDNWGNTAYWKLQGADVTISFSYTSAQAVEQWVINHGLNRNPSVTVTDLSGNLIIPDVIYNSANQITLTFNGATAGYAYLN